MSQTILMTILSVVRSEVFLNLKCRGTLTVNSLLQALVTQSITQLHRTEYSITSTLNLNLKVCLAQVFENILHLSNPINGIGKTERC